MRPRMRARTRKCGPAHGACVTTGTAMHRVSGSISRWTAGACSRLRRLVARADDAKRFQEQATAFEMANPGWFERRHEYKQRRRAPSAKRAGPKRAKPSPRRPRPPLTPWKAFLKVSRCALARPRVACVL